MKGWMMTPENCNVITMEKMTVAEWEFARQKACWIPKFTMHTYIVIFRDERLMGLPGILLGWADDPELSLNTDDAIAMIKTAKEFVDHRRN